MNRRTRSPSTYSIPNTRGRTRRNSYVAPVIQGDAVDDAILSEEPWIATVRQKLVQYRNDPFVYPTLLDTVNRVRQAKHEHEARRRALDIAEENLRENRPNRAEATLAHYNATTRWNQAAEEWQYTRSQLEQVFHMMALLEQVWERETEVEEEVMEDVPLPVIHRETDCPNDQNAANEFVSGISLDELVEGQIVKLSDGHCYNYKDIVDFYKSQTRDNKPFVSPFTRDPFTRADIQMVQTVQRQLGLGGRRMRRRTRRRRRKGKTNEK